MELCNLNDRKFKISILKKAQQDFKISDKRFTEIRNKNQ